MRFSGHWPIFSLLLAFLVCSGIYNATVPLGEGPDEHGHLAYVLFLANAGRLPEQRVNQAESDAPGEGHQPPLAYVLALPAVAWLPVEERRLELTANPFFVWSGGDQVGAFMRGSREYWPWQGMTLAWHMARLASMFAGSITLLCTYLAARVLWPLQRAPALLAATLVAFNPQFLFSCALVSNDPLLAAFGALILWRSLALLTLPTPPTWQSFRVVGVIFGFALLTKQSALLYGPLLLWVAWRVAQGSWRQGMGYTLAWGLPALLVAGWWYGRNQYLYGDLLAATLFRAHFAGQPFAWGDLHAWIGALSQLHDSFWARFGWMSLYPPSWMHWFYGFGLVIALVGWMRGIRPNQRLNLSPWAAPLILCLLSIIWLLSFVSTAGMVAWQGRMLFPAIAAIGLLIAGGMQRLPWALAWVVVYIACACTIPFAVITPAYPWVVQPAAEAEARLGRPVYARFAQSWEEGVTLRGWQQGRSATPGTDLSITLTWHSLAPIPHNWTVFVHLVSADGTIITESNQIPSAGSHPFTIWTPGDWVQDQHHLPLPANLPPGRYHLNVGLYLPAEDGFRSSVWAEDGSHMGDHTDLGTVLIGSP